MKKKEKSKAIRHILVALDASPHSRTALAAAAELARELQAELRGLFVEDVNLLKLAQLPFAQEIHYPRATTQKLDTSLMEKELRNQAAWAQECLRQIAEQASLAWSFQVARGGVASELLAAALEVDLLVLGRLSRRLALSHGVGSTARTAVTEAQQPVLLLGTDFDLSQPLLAFYDGSTIAQVALDIAADLARVSGHLRVLIWANDDAEVARQHQRDVTTRLNEKNLIIGFRSVLTHENIANIIRHSGVGLFVIGDTSTHFIQKTIQKALEQTDHPILVVR